MSRLELRHSKGTTPIWVGADAVREAGPELRELIVDRRVFALTAKPVCDLHRDDLDRLCRGAAEVTVLDVPDGEAAKTVAVAAQMWRRLVLTGGKRDSVVLAFGGGSVGDLSGFVAGCFLRGIGVIQVPTTLLAQVDAAIGGKTAINLPQAKNSVGVFHHPLAIVASTSILGTLSPRQLRSGLFEVVKTGAMLDAGLLDALEGDLERVLEADAEALVPIVSRTAAAKIAIVEEDPEEQDRRRLLNFGHTLGHAIEMTAGTLEHGEAVAYGMLFVLGLAKERGLAESECRRLECLIERIGLPRLPADMAVDDLLDHVRRDKKARESGISWVLPQSLGRGVIVDDVDMADVERRLPGFLSAGC